MYTYWRVMKALKSAYVAACTGLSLANKLKCKAAGKAHRSRIMGRMNKIRSELKRIEKAHFMPLDFVVYAGIVLPLVKQNTFKLYSTK